MWLLLWLACATDAEPLPTPDLELNPSLLPFEAEIGTCDTDSFVIENSGETELNLSLSGPSACSGEFELATTGMRIWPGDEVTIQVRYCPTEPGTCTALLAVAAAEGPAAELTLVGVATSPDQDADGYRVSDGDCDDDDPDVHPAAVELEDGEDDDCDGETDEGTPSSDDDADGWSEREGDCDDEDATVNPSADERENGQDDDCDGWTDNRTPAFDDDGDGYSEADGDCHDGNALTYPLASEFPDGHPNGIDDDCDSMIDEQTP